MPVVKKDVPKIAAYALVGDAWLFQHVAPLFPGEKQQSLREAEQTIYEHFEFMRAMWLTLYMGMKRKE